MRRELDRLDVLHALDDAPRDTLGMRASDLAHFLGERIEEVLSALDAFRREGLVEHERDPMGSEWYTLSDAGEEFVKEQVARAFGERGGIVDFPGTLDGLI